MLATIKEKRAFPKHGGKNCQWNWWTCLQTLVNCSKKLSVTQTRQVEFKSIQFYLFVTKSEQQLHQGALFCKVRKDSILTERQPQQSNNSLANSWKEKVPTSNQIAGNLLATKAVTGNHSQPVRGYVSLATRSCHIPYGQQLLSIFVERPVKKPHICNQKSRPLLAVKQNAS